MATPVIQKEIGFVYENKNDPGIFDPTTGDAPDGVNNLLTTADLTASVPSIPLDEVIHANGKNRIVEDLNRTMVRALRHSLSPFDSRASLLLTANDIQISADPSETAAEVRCIILSRQEEEKFSSYLTTTDSLDPFVIQIMGQ